MTRHIIFASYGNDSCALIQWAHERGLEDVTVLYNDTGWASKDWAERVSGKEEWVRWLGFTPARTSSKGLEALVKERKGWPRQGMQFCTLWLKIFPAAEWLDANDPDGEAVCMVGVRREESRNRANFPEYEKASENYGGRDVWAPLVDHKSTDVKALLDRAGIPHLPHRSMECFPCINSNRTDLRLLANDETRIAEIERIEREMGVTKNGKPRTMFRPYRHMGAVGIREVVKWAMSGRGKYDPDNEPESGCDSGWCGI